MIKSFYNGLTKNFGGISMQKVKKLFANFLAVIMFLGVLAFSPVTTYANTITVTIDGVPVVFPDTQPQIVDGRTLVPVRPVFEALNFQVEWEQSTQTATLTRNTDQIQITVGQQTFYTNGEALELDVPAMLISDRTMVPLRLPLESVGYQLEWCGDTQTAMILSAPSTPILNQRLDPWVRYWFPDETTYVTAEQQNQAYEWEVWRLINLERTNRGLRPLLWDDRLADASRINSISQSIHGYYGHRSPHTGNPADRAEVAGWPASGRRIHPISPDHWYLGSGFPGGGGYAEIIVGGIPNRRITPAETVQAWMESPDHRRNILLPDRDRQEGVMGVGFYQHSGNASLRVTAKQASVVLAELHYDHRVTAGGVTLQDKNNLNALVMDQLLPAPPLTDIAPLRLHGPAVAPNSNNRTGTPATGLFDRPYIQIATFTHNNITYIADQYTFSDRDALLATTTLSEFLTQLVAEAHRTDDRGRLSASTHDNIVLLSSGLSGGQPILSVFAPDLSIPVNSSTFTALQARALPVEQLLTILELDFIP
jgi:uncharacterized protein YkwD